MPFSINFLVALIPRRPLIRMALLDDLKKALAERALNAEIDHHLANGEAGNSRNGYGKKTVVTDTALDRAGCAEDRQSTFDPHLIAQYQRRCPGFDEKILSMYALGMSVREIVGHLRDLYGVDVSPDFDQRGDGRPSWTKSPPGKAAPSNPSTRLVFSGRSAHQNPGRRAGAQ